MLKEFYSALKKAGERLRFVFATGVTSCAFTGLPAGLNLLNDLTLDRKPAGIYGFACDEIESCLQGHPPIALHGMKGAGFMPEASAVTDLLESVKHRCCWYVYDGRTMAVSQFSVTNCTDKASSEDFRLNSGPSAKFISDITKGSPSDLPEDRLNEFDANFLNHAEAGKPEPAAGLLQTGCLTADKIPYDPEGSALCSLRMSSQEAGKFSGVFETFYSR
ncbi:MAG: AAA family ATPase [Deltaproteobacteria bacterium]|jgi:hypothetical protein|nr:AAA family ATPase [Deltaproteobacteria bacterium]